MNEELLNILKKNEVTGLTIVDVGAKDSLDYIKEIAEITTMHAFEPNPAEFKNLKTIYKKNSFKSFHLNQAALGEKPGSTTFHVTKHASMSSLLKPDIVNYEKHFGSYKEFDRWKNYLHTEETIPISIETADNYFKGATIDYLKLDTQGSELSILKGSKDLIENKKIQVIKVEVSTISIYKDQALFSDIDLFMRNHNYVLIDFITYRNDHIQIFNSKQAHAHYAPCGDAIYVLDENNSSKEKSVKKGLLLYWLGYNSIADFHFTKAGLNKNETMTLKSIKTTAYIPFYKRLTKNIFPPLMYRLINRFK